MADRPGVPRFWSKGQEAEQLRRVSGMLDEIQSGKTNNAFIVSLDLDPSTSTVVVAPLAELGQVAVFSPQNAAAASDTSLYSEVTNGEITINHAASASVRTYGIVLNG